MLEVHMPLVAVGSMLVLLKFLLVEPFAGWAWWAVLAPFGAAVLWWWWADASGLTRRRAERREAERLRAKRARQAEELGLTPRRGGRR